MDKKELNNLIDRISLTGPGGVDKIKKVLKSSLSKIENDSDRINVLQPYSDWYDPFLWQDELVWPSSGGGGNVDVDVLKLLNSAPTFICRGRLKDGDKRYIVKHPLMDYEGAEIVLMRYASKNTKRRYDEDNDEKVLKFPKKGYCVACGAGGRTYFAFSEETSYDDIAAFLSENITSFDRHFGIALRIPNPEWTRPATMVKNGIYKGIPESLWSDVLPISVSHSSSAENYGIGLI